MKKIIGFVVVLAMVLAMLPIAVFAADNYYVAGVSGLCGSEWNPSDANNKMTQQGDVYTITYTNVAVGNYQFKVTDGTWNNSWGADGGSQNYSFANNVKGSITITFNPATKAISVAGPGVGTVTFEANSITAVGAGAGGFLNNESWNPSAAANHMANNDGVWTITYPSVAAGSYEFKFAANDSWGDNWGVGGAVTVGEWADIWYNANNTTFTVAEDNSSVTLSLDLTGFDYGTKNGAKVLVEVVAPGADEEEEDHQAQEIVSISGESVGEETPWTYTFNLDSTGVLNIKIGDCNPGWRYKITYPNGDESLYFSASEWSVGPDADHEVTAVGQYTIKLWAYNADEYSNVNGTVSATLSFISSGSVEIPKEEYIVVGSIYEGGNDCTADASAINTLYEFEPTETGVYTFTAPAGVLLGNWNTFTYPYDKLGDSKTNVVEWECTSVGQSVLIGITVDTTITVEKKGEAELPEEIVYAPYVNVHTPNASNQPVLEDGQQLVGIDITAPQAVYADSNGIYHLGSVNGPIIYMNLLSDGVDMALYYYGGIPALHLRGQIRDESDKLVAAYDFLNSMKAYVDASDDEGFYPMTVDLAMFMLAYGTSNKWFDPAFSPFEEITDSIDADSAFLVACYYIAEEGDEPEIPETDENEIRVTGSADWLGNWDPANANGLMNRVSEGVYEISFKDVAAGSYTFKFTNHGTWDENWGVGGSFGSDIPMDVAELSDVTITFCITDGSYQIDIVAAEEEPVLGDYYVAGSADMFGSDWNPADENNRLTANGDGSYSITYVDVAAGNYEFKFTKGSWDENWGVGGANGGNIPVELTAISDVTITFYEADGTYEIAITPKEGGDPNPDPVLSDYYVAGNSGLCGSEWSPADPNNRMIDNGDGTYSLTINNIAAGSYEFKITKGNWNENWGVGGANGGNVSVQMDAAGFVTITFNPATGEITVNDQQAVPPIATGDVSIDGIFFVMILAAMGVVAIVVCKKKFF